MFRAVLMASLLAMPLAGCNSTAERNYSFALPGAASTDTLGVVNAARRSGKRSALRIDRSAQRAAERHARDMANARRMAHELPGGPRFGKRMQRDGIRTRAAENIARGQRDVGAAVTAWMNSAGHRRNLLDKGFGGVGIASAKGADGRLYWAMVLVP